MGLDCDWELGLEGLDLGAGLGGDFGGLGFAGFALPGSSGAGLGSIKSESFNPSFSMVSLSQLHDREFLRQAHLPQNASRSER